MKASIRSIMRGAAAALFFPEASPPGSRWSRHRTDAEALRSDWERVGQDIRKAMMAYEKEQREKEVWRVAESNVPAFQKASLCVRLGLGIAYINPQGTQYQFDASQADQRRYLHIQQPHSRTRHSMRH